MRARLRRAGTRSSRPLTFRNPFSLIFLRFFPQWDRVSAAAVYPYGVGRGADAVRILRPPPWLAAAKSATLSRLNSDRRFGTGPEQVPKLLSKVYDFKMAPLPPIWSWT